MSFGTVFRLLVCMALLQLAATWSTDVFALSQETGLGTFDRSIDAGGRERTYHLHLPGSVAPPARMPVLIVLHGGGGNGRNVEQTTGFSQLADQNGFIAVYPDGSGRLSNRLTWNAFNCCAYAYSEQVDDVEFISAMIDQLIADYPVDPARIYVTGHSNGGMMTYRIGCELADKVAAIAPYAGALNTGSCTPSQPLPVLDVHGEDDTHVPVAGGVTPNRGLGVDNTRVDKPLSFAMQTWAEINDCNPTPLVEASAAAAVTTYTGCSGGAEVESMVIHGWGHKWPNPAIGAPLDAASTIWDFVSQFTRPGV